MRPLLTLPLLIIITFGFLILPRQAEGEGPSNNVNELADLKVSFDRVTKRVTAISAAKGESLPLKPPKKAKAGVKEMAYYTIADYGKYFGLKEPLRESKLAAENIDGKGNTHLKYNQEYLGIPVFGGQIIVHLDKNHSPYAINGRVVPDLSLDTEAEISKEEAIAKAKEIFEEQFGLDDGEVSKTELYIFNKGIVEHRSDNKSTLVWRVELYSQFPKKREFYFIEAKNGELVYQLTGIKEAINRRIYDCSLYPFLLACGLNYTYFGYTYGRSEGQGARGTNPWWFNTDVDDLYSLTNTIHNYYYNTFSLNGGNGYGGIGNGSNNPVTVTDGWVYIDDVGYPCPNAFFDGYSINFCYGVVVTDIVAHEYGHAVLEFAVPDIPYTGESGAFHEAYADISGEAVEYYGGGSNDWIVGDDVTLVDLDPRNLSDPTTSSDSLGNLPDRFYSPNFYCGSSDNYGVHHNSTVVSHAAYLMAMGGNHNGCIMEALGRAKEEQVLYQAMTNYITSAVDFNQAYTALNLACDDLYDAADCHEVTKALQAVELNQAGSCSGSARQEPSCATGPFTDVPVSQTFYIYIENLYDLNIVSGYGDGTFGPNDPVTRGQMAKFIKNAFGFTTNTTCGDFSDVPPSQAFYDQITTLKCEEVIQGYGDGTFGPNDEVTRGQAAKFAVNGARERTGNPNFLPIDENLDDFLDVPPAQTFYDYIMAAYSNAIINGNPDGTFGPNDATVRGAMSKIVDNTRIQL